MSFKCKECGQEFTFLRSLHAHVKKHDMVLGDYYVKNYARKDKLTGELIPFKNYKQYFSTYFLNNANMVEWCDTADKAEVKKFIIDILKDRKEQKELTAAPPDIYLKTAGLPDVDTCKRLFGSYSQACEAAGLKPMLSRQLPTEFYNDFTATRILIDTREQQPLNFKNSRVLKLDVGDYGVMGDDYSYTFVDRKSYQDFCSTVTHGYNRFVKELERCKSLGCFLFIVIETAFDKMEDENKKGFKKFKLDYVFHQMREIQAEYSDCCQFVFSGSRKDSELIIPKLLVLGSNLWSVDVQYFWNKHIIKDGLGNRSTKTKKRVQRYKPTAGRKRGVFG